MRPLLDTVWDSSKGCFTKPDPVYGYWDYANLENQLITHTWLFKRAMEEDETLKKAYMDSLLTALLNVRPDMKETLLKLR